MGFREWAIDLLGGKVSKSDGTIIDLCNLSSTVYIKELAINSAINLIGNALALSEFKTYEKGEEVRGNNYYALNVEPNSNISAKRFWKKFVHQLVYNNEALIVRQENMFYLAESFTRDEKAFLPNYFKDVSIDNLKLDRGYQEKEVLYFKLNEKSIINIISNLYEDYGKLVEYSKSSYRKNNAKRGIMNIPTNYPKDKISQERLSKLLGEDIQRFYGAENGAVLPLTGGVTYDDISSDSYKNATDSRDIRNLVDDIFDFVAIGFGIPPQLLKGSVADLDKANDSFIKFAMEPLNEMIEDEVNRKFYSKNQYLENTYVKVDTTRLKTTNITSLAQTIDILARNGVHNIDENRELIGKEPLRTKESQERHITKNYELAKESK